MGVDVWKVIHPSFIDFKGGCARRKYRLHMEITFINFSNHFELIYNLHGESSINHHCSTKRHGAHEYVDR